MHLNNLYHGLPDYTERFFQSWLVANGLVGRAKAMVQAGNNVQSEKLIKDYNADFAARIKVLIHGK